MAVILPKMINSNKLHVNFLDMSSEKRLVFVNCLKFLHGIGPV